MYVLMGANGNITSKTARLLLSAGQPVRVLGRNAAHLEPLKQAGAEVLVGGALDPDFLTRAFSGASAVYTMIPPDYVSPDHRSYQKAVSEAIAQAIAKSGTTHVVNLSSVGASLPSGTGPIAGLHDQEQRLDKLASVNVLHVRATYFLENHLHAIGLIKALGVYPGMIAPNVPLAMIATQDVAVAVVRELTKPTYTGHTVRHLLGARDYTMSEVTRVLGAAVGKPELKYVQSDPVQAKAGMVQSGFSQNVADLFEEMSNAMSDGRIQATYRRDAASTTPTTLEQFAPTFAAAFTAGGH
jgi:uncharacterized protein YbjT (DUF2867 family)